MTDIPGSLLRHPPLPFTSIGVVSGSSNEALSLLAISALQAAGVGRFVRIQMPALPSAAPSLQRRVTMTADKLFSKFLPGSLAPNQMPLTNGIEEMALELLTADLTQQENTIDAYLVIGEQPEFFNKLQGDKLPPIYKLTIGAPADAAYAAYGLTEVLTKAPVALLRLTRCGQATAELAPMEMAVQTHLVSATHTKATLLATLPEFLVSTLAHLARVGTTTVISDNASKEARVTAMHNVSWLTAVKHFTSLSTATADRLANRFQWLMAYMPKPAPGQPVNWDNLRPLLPPADRFWADPFLVQRDGASWLFFEEAPFNSAKGNDIGHISVAQIGNNGFIGPVMRALDLPWHLSYPNVFEHEGEWYMIPESGSQKRVELYQCTQWPNQWAHHSVLLDNYAGYDASILYDQGLYWMFVARRPAGVVTTDVLDLFCAPSPLGPWAKHASSPVVLDVQSARPGGRPFVQQDGRLVRPVQDSSGGIYGRALRFQLISELSPLGYREQSVHLIEPNSASGILGVHSYAATDELIVIDLCRKVSRLAWLRRLQSRLPAKLVSNSWNLAHKPIL